MTIVRSFEPMPAESGSSLETRVLRLEAIEAIRALKAHYSALADAKYTSDYERIPSDQMDRIAGEQAACFTHDAVWAGGNDFGDDLTGREALHAWFRRSPWRFAMHYYTSESIRVSANGNEAEAYWRLMQVAIRSDTARAVWLGAVTHERYRFEEGRWLISYMRFSDLQMMELADTTLPVSSALAGLDAIRQRSAS
ncbi:nuclear transport factor 2 family protein [Paraburkholderia sp. ZP32-5]|uniref:nuclear transport factor 2 family protein n=1 Tax=Paraburkholderia sp. ZP32-5 TaxID=2883245 RepID=UPI001F1A4863|nr:nuclear transport factor 2 family protein [Paraburkholderia sp. ZP32-5]